MPELPEVETIKNAVKKAVNGAKIINTEVFCRRFRVEIPADFENKIQNAVIKNCRRKAKYLLLDLDNGITVIWHLGMSGIIKICENRPKTLEKHDHVVITTDKGCLIFNDARRFGMLSYCKTDEQNLHPVLKGIAPDPFDEEVDGKYLHEKFKNKTLAVKVALLDQKIIAGIGNIYASEALYKANILPMREAKSLSLKECEKLNSAVREVLNQAIKAGGSTLRDYRKPDGSMGYFQNLHCVYNKTGQACPNCKCNIQKTGGIKKIVLGGRSTFYCETLQK